MVLLACAIVTASAPGLLVAPAGAGPLPAPQIIAPQIMAPQIIAQPVATTVLAAIPAGSGDGATAPVVRSASNLVAQNLPTSPQEANGAAGASSAQTDASAPGADLTPPHDPWENTTRSIFAFDTSVDKHLLGPVSRGYSAVLPFVVRHHISLVLANLDEPITIANNLLQLRMDAFGKSLVRFTLNSTIGLAGIFDFASHHKLEHHTADFGQTLGRWGAKPGGFVMLPLLGPANVRDGFGRAVDLMGDPVSWLLGGITSTFGGSRAGAVVVDGRANAEPALRAVYDSTDPYAATRSGYMQARAAAVREARGEAEVLPDFDAPEGRGPEGRGPEGRAPAGQGAGGNQAPASRG